MHAPPTPQKNGSANRYPPAGKKNLWVLLDGCGTYPPPPPPRFACWTHPVASEALCTPNSLPARSERAISSGGPRTTNTLYCWEKSFGSFCGPVDVHHHFFEVYSIKELKDLSPPQTDFWREKCKKKMLSDENSYGLGYTTREIVKNENDLLFRRFWVKEPRHS